MPKDDKVEVKPKVFLDEPLKKVLNRHYSACLGEEFIGLECFSDPKMDSHVCNVYAKLDGDKNCNRCGHKVGRPCEVTCDIHHFCLAVYAMRLGIVTKSKSLTKRISDNLGLPFEDLYKKVMKLHELRAEAREDASSKEEGSKKVEDAEDGAAEELVTIAQAAKVCGCTHAKMRSFVEAGKLERVAKGKATYLKKKDVELFKESMAGA